MTSFNQLKKQYFFAQQTIFATDVKTWQKYEQAAVCEATSTTFPADTTSTWRLWFQQKGIAGAASRSLSDMWWEWLGGQGFTQGTLRQRFVAFYTDGSVNL